MAFHRWTGFSGYNRSLLLDLVPLILDHVQEYLPAVSYATLASRSLLSHAWSSSALRRLYQAPYLPDANLSFARASLLYRIISFSLTLAASVRSDDLGRWTSQLTTNAPSERSAIWRSVLALLAWCPHLARSKFLGVTTRDALKLEDTLGTLEELEEPRARTTNEIRHWGTRTALEDYQCS